MLERLELLVGKENIEKLKNSKVLILGLGGVGSYAVEALTRSGIGTLILVDYDTIDISNLNRQLMTTRQNIGHKKTEVWKRRIQEINPDCKVILIDKKIAKETVQLLLDQKPDYIIDACDTIEVKKELIRTCKNNNISLISSMGTGNKMHPELLEITELNKTSYDPIARILRKMVKDEKIKGKIMVVASKEVPKKINSKKIGSNAFVPATAGLLCASYIINKIVGEK